MNKWIFAAGLLALSSAFAQHSPHAHHPHDGQSGAAHGHAPYAGMQEREIKALSLQEIDDLRAGRGMSMALPAELNGYPGPLHVLELSDQLGLSEAQVADTRRNFERMHEAARALGEQLIAAETRLDRLFRDGIANRDTLQAATRAAATAQAQLRALHLGHHLDMMDILTTEQVIAYNRLRGYD